MIHFIKLIPAVLYAAGIILYQQTGIFWFLLPGLILLSVVLMFFLFGSAALIAGENDDSDEGDKIEQNSGIRAITQMLAMSFSYQIYQIGYVFASGMFFTTSFVLFLAVIYEKLTKNV